MERLENYKVFLIGIISSFTSWEVWENVLVSLTVAFIGGFLAAAGKGFWTWCSRKRKDKKNVPD